MEGVAVGVGVAVDQGFTMPPDDPAAYARALRLGTGVSRRIGGFAKGLFLASGIALGIGVALHVSGLAISSANLIGLAVTLVLCSLASIPLRDPALRAATVIVSNHQLREAREWRAETGTRMPRGRPAIRRWLDEHPAGPGRGSLLTVIGQFADAEAYWRSHPAETPEVAFGVEVQRETAMLLSGREPDLARLHELWAELPDTTERRNRRECLAILEAEARLRAGADPIQLIASARGETGPVSWRVRIPCVVGFQALVPVVALVLMTAFRLAMAHPGP